MSPPRQQRKARFACKALVALAFCAPAALGAAWATGPEERLVVNAATGLAISGADPVAYFTDGKPRFGRADIELSQGGAVWRFRNEGNRAAFKEHPEIYRPQFGGYDPVAIARGVWVAGHPLNFALTGGKLYLFYSEEARAEFLAEPERIVAAAERRWPAVARAIGR
jgi:YHS domain-containing protein